MKYIQRTERVGEYLGPVDWNYDFASHGWNKTGGSSNPDLIPGYIARLKQLEGDPDAYQATTDGGWPRVGWGKVLQVGMYDGWPYWRPVPSVLIQGTLGSSWHSFLSITDIEKL